jgi:hypothetical protein
MSATATIANARAQALFAQPLTRIVAMGSF